MPLQKMGPAERERHEQREREREDGRLADLDRKDREKEKTSWRDEAADAIARADL